MSEEITPTPSPEETPKVLEPEIVEQPEVVAEQSLVPFAGPETSYRNSLDELPDEVKMRLNVLIANGDRGEKCRSAMMTHYAKSDLLEKVSVSSKTYSRYIEKHLQSIQASADAQKVSEKTFVLGLNETTNDLKAVAEETLKPGNPVENKKAALIALFENCDKRRKLLESRQSQGFIDPHIEVLINQYMKEQRALVESLVTLQEELAKDADKELVMSYKVFLESLLTQMNYTYKAIHGDTKFAEFQVELEQRFKLVLENWLKKMQGGSGK